MPKISDIALPARSAPVSVGAGSVVAGWTALVILTAAAFAAGFIVPRETLPAWLWMWLLAGALWAGFKLLSWLRAGGWKALGFRTLPYAAWVGMDAAPFALRKERRHRPVLAPLMLAGMGAALLWLVIPAVEGPILRGWLGMTALLLGLHFGAFALLAAFWNRIGFHVDPIMAAPWKARTLGDFWGTRWNRAFSDVARAHLFRGLVRRFGPISGTLAGFLFSGLAHELVISVPAGGGYGLPTGYFLLQGVGILAERRFHLRRTPAGTFFLWLIVLAPAFWLFHPPFMKEVIDPFLTTLETLLF